MDRRPTWPRRGLHDNDLMHPGTISLVRSPITLCNMGSLRKNDMIDSTSRPQHLCVVSGGSAIRYYSHLNQAVWAELHEVEHRVELSLTPDVPSPYWYKFLAIRRVLPHFEWVLWMDDDAYFTDWSNNTIAPLIAGAEAVGHYMVISEGAPELDGSWTKINSGVMLLRNERRSWHLLDVAADAEPSEIRRWWDEQRDGMFTNGDQDTIWWALSTQPELRDGFTITPHRALNSRAEYYTGSLSDAAIVHFPGPGDKELRIGRFARRFGLGKELVPAELLARYTRSTPRPVTLLEIGYRGASQTFKAAAKRFQRKITFVRNTGRWR